MDIKKLTEAFYAENSHLAELLDKTAAGSVDEKVRGYGIALVKARTLRFGIPFRSRISHNHCFKTSQQKGLDFSKSVLLEKDDYISPDPFKIPVPEFLLVREKSVFIEKQFNKYVERYVKATAEGKETLLAREYRFTTLQNYHLELGLA
ncbi:hypothetical protein HFO33_32565 [Rhizobium leguminosarum]|uniref:type III toxin-antitoxin system TenpIN family toxin n=1 Tax=Rhizobium leguminosarum TaxID=384 RepID=UPI001C9550E2|nr:hypothetical protein [Rhizobium leguminosarum]MBY5721238.1 hypothetical protein [Rhizobium leguminosarum]